MKTKKQKYLKYLSVIFIAVGITQLCIAHDTPWHTFLQVAFATGCLVYCGLKYYNRKRTKKPPQMDVVALGI